MLTADNVNTIISSIATLLAAFGLIYLAQQTREATKARRLQATVTIFSEFGSEENRELRRCIYNELPEYPARFSDIVGLKAERVCNSFAQLGFLVNNGLIEKEPLLAFYGDTIVRCWLKLQPHVEDVQKQRTKFHWIEFRNIAQEAEYYLRRHNAYDPNFHERHASERP